MSIYDMSWFLLQRPEFHALSAPALQSPQVLETHAPLGRPATEMSNSLGRLVFASPTADRRAIGVELMKVDIQPSIR
jgi:hypothetical protein